MSAKWRRQPPNYQCTRNSALENLIEQYAGNINWLTGAIDLLSLLFQKNSESQLGPIVHKARE